MGQVLFFKTYVACELSLQKYLQKDISKKNKPSEAHLLGNSCNGLILEV